MQCRMECGESSAMSTGPPANTFYSHKDRWYVVWPLYAGIFCPMALYITHDVIDSRWRRRRTRISWYRAYWFANIIFIVAFFVYFVAQVGGPDPDHKEAAASLVVMAVNILSIMKIFRGLMAFQATAILAHRFGLARAVQPRGARHIWAYEEYVGDLVDKNASCLLDDDSPGEGARVAWWRLVWANLWGKPWHKLRVHKPGAEAESGIAYLMKGPVLQDSKDLIIMAVAWVWGCLSQVCVNFSPARRHIATRMVKCAKGTRFRCRKLSVECVKGT